MKYFLTKKKWDILLFSVPFSHNISFDDPTVFLTYYLASFFLFGIMSVSFFYHKRRQIEVGVLIASHILLLNKNKSWRSGGNSIECWAAGNTRTQFLQMFTASISYLIYLYDSTKSLNHTKILNIWNWKITALISLVITIISDMENTQIF